MPRKLLKRITYNWHIKIVSVVLAALLWIYVDSLKDKERFITVPFEIRNVPQGYTISSDTPPYVKIVLRGKESNLLLVAAHDIKAYVDMEKGKRGKIKGIVRIDKRGIPPGVSINEVSPRTVDMVIENIITRSVEALPVVIGKPAEGYVFTDAFSDPPVVSIRGPASVVNRIATVHTEPISIDGLAETVRKGAKVQMENSKVSLVDGETLSVTIVIEEEYVFTRIVDLPVEVHNLRDGLRAQPEPQSISALVKAPRRLEEKLSRKAIHVYISSEGIEYPGSYDLPVLFDSEMGEVSLVRLDPEFVSVKVETQKTRRK
jgi:YbbR domain-containing protein